MDGLALLERVKQAGLPTQVILLSGYGEFEYAKQAMKLGAVDYLLKPCRPEEILAVVSEALRLRESQQRSAQLAREQFLCRLMQPGAEVAGYQLAVGDGPSLVGVVRRAPEAAGAAIRQALSPLCGQCLEVFQYGEDWCWVGSCVARDLLRVTLQEQCARLPKLAAIGVGGVRPCLALLHESYAEARRALEAHDDLPQQAIFLYDEVTAAKPPGEGALIDPEMTMREAEILAHMQAGRYAQAIDATALWLEHLRQHPDYSRRQVQMRAVSLLLGLQRTSQVQSIPAIRWKEELIHGINSLPTVESIDELSTIMTKYLQHLVGILSSHRPVHRTVQAALQIVAAQYQSNLTLEAVAREVFVSTSYLNTLFKQEMGINFLDYLHQFRIERAKELLVREPLKIFAVAKLVGYQDERHFSATFKRWTGISPSQFQRSVLQ